MICVFIPEECQVDDDCGENFRCESIGHSIGCASPEEICPEGEECEPIESIDCEEEEFVESFCVPEEIECDSDDACPADWSCQEFTDYICDAIPVPVDDPEGSEEIPEEDWEGSCTEETESFCVPAGFYLGGEVEATTTVSSEDGTGSARDPDSSEDLSTPSDGSNGEGNEEGNGEGNAEGNGEGSDNADGESNEPSDPADTSASDANEAGDEEESGCNASSSPFTTWSLLSFLMLGMLLRRRSITLKA
jgi:uncharacterized protein (TIGR03382 family)